MTMAILASVRNQLLSRLKQHERNLGAEIDQLNAEVDRLGAKIALAIRKKSAVECQISEIEAQPIIDDTAGNPVFALKMRGAVRARADHAGV
jgi:phage shock protein A